MDDILQTMRNIGIEDHRRDGGPIEDGHIHHPRRLACEGLLSRQAFVEHDSEREQICAAIELFSGDLLR